MKAYLQIIGSSDCSLSYCMPDKVNLYHAFILLDIRMLLMTFYIKRHLNL